MSAICDVGIMGRVRVTIFSLPIFPNNYYQLYKLFCKAGKIFLDICYTLTAFDN